MFSSRGITFNSISSFIFTLVLLPLPGSHHLISFFTRQNYFIITAQHRTITITICEYTVACVCFIQLHGLVGGIKGIFEKLNGIAGSYGSIFSFLRNLRTVLIVAVSI